MHKSPPENLITHKMNLFRIRSCTLRKKSAASKKCLLWGINFNTRNFYPSTCRCHHASLKNGIHNHKKPFWTLSKRNSAKVKVWNYVINVSLSKLLKGTFPDSMADCLVISTPCVKRVGVAKHNRPHLHATIVKSALSAVV